MAAPPPPPPFGGKATRIPVSSASSEPNTGSQKSFPPYSQQKISLDTKECVKEMLPQYWEKIDELTALTGGDRWSFEQDFAEYEKKNIVGNMFEIFFQIIYELKGLKKNAAHWNLFVKYATQHRIVLERIPDAEWDALRKANPKHYDSSFADVYVADGVVRARYGRDVVTAASVNRLIESLPKDLSPEIEQQLPKYKKEVDALLAKIKTLTNTRNQWSYEVDFLECQNRLDKGKLGSVVSFHEGLLRDLAESIGGLNSKEIEAFTSRASSGTIIAFLKKDAKFEHKVYFTACKQIAYV